MLDPILALKAGLAALAGAAILLLLGGLPWRKPRSRLTSAVAALGVGLGIVLGGKDYGLSPHWPPREDLDRFVFLLLPATIAVELFAAIPRLPGWIGWLARLAVAGAAAPVLLHGSVYLGEPGPDSGGWTANEKLEILCGLGLALAGVWAALALLARRTTGRATPLALSICCGAAAAVLMLSGYATGGPLGVPLAGALAGIGLASLILAPPVKVNGAIGVGIVGLFGLVVIGHFFNELTLPNALLLFFAPLLAWLPEFPVIRRADPWLRGAARLILVALPLAFVGWRAWGEFNAKSQPAAPGEVTADDYANFGK